MTDKKLKVTGLPSKLCYTAGSIQIVQLVDAYIHHVRYTEMQLTRDCLQTRFLTVAQDGGVTSVWLHQESCINKLIPNLWNSSR
jgi:hypothetical protein